MKRRLESGRASAEQGARPGHVADRPRQFAAWCSIKQLAVSLDFVTTAPTDPEDACRAFLRRHGIVGVKRGRTILISPGDVDRALRSL